jgi:hypothetical protein
MSIEDLREQGILLPEEEWGHHRLKTTVSQAPLGIGYVVALLSLVAMYLGAGSALTWVGTGTFLVALYSLTWMCDRAVLRQRARVRREREGGDGRDGPAGAGEESAAPSNGDA